MRDPVSCALPAGHGGPHKGVSLPTSMSKMHTHWEWSESPEIGSGGSGVPEDAAVMGPVAIASFSGRVFDNMNEGVQGLLPPSLPMAEFWRHAGIRFRIGIVGGAVSLVVATIFLWLFIGQPRWQFAVAIGVSYVFFTVALVQAGRAIRSYQDRIKGLGVPVRASGSSQAD